LLASSLAPEIQAQLLAEQGKLGGVEVMESLSERVRQEAREVISLSFVSGYRWVMAFNAGLALLSALVSFWTIRSPKKNVT